MLKKICWFMNTQLGFDAKKVFFAFFGLPRYVRDFFRFRSFYAGRLELLPCLHDWNEEGGQTKNEYFWQDLLVARMIFEAKPAKHVDIGSRVDGFIAHIASFREIEIFDVRPISKQIPGVIFKQVDFMKPFEGMSNYCDSISCLHALEHFGLGRYGEAIHPKGFEIGFTNMANLLKKNGVFYLSVPIGINRVEFNANWIFDPRSIIDLAMKNSLCLFSFTAIHQEGKIEVLLLNEARLADLASQRYVLGIFTFIKNDPVKER